MRVALLSAGPSLRQTFDPSSMYDVRIVVNAAAAVFHGDYWSCGDSQTVDRIEPIGKPVLYTSTAEDGRLRSNAKLAQKFGGFRRILWGEVGLRMKPPHGWSTWSITAAVPLAVDLGATAIHVYGHDCAGTVDVNGHDLKKRAANWKRVAADWDAVCEWAGHRGVRIHHHFAGAEACA